MLMINIELMMHANKRKPVTMCQQCEISQVRLIEFTKDFGCF